MLRKLLLPLLLISSSIVTIANSASAAADSTWGTTFGNTAFEAPIQIACNPARATIPYRTVAGGNTFNGNFWIRNVSGCNTDRINVNGYFEEQNAAGTEWCSGQLDLSLNESTGNGLARWRDIRAVRGYTCSGTGTTPQLPLLRLD